MNNKKEKIYLVILCFLSSVSALMSLFFMITVSYVDISSLITIILSLILILYCSVKLLEPKKS